METILVELRNKNALSILKSLEEADIIKMVKGNNFVKETPVQFKGSISKNRAVEMVKEIEKSRNQWDDRTI